MQEQLFELDQRIILHPTCCRMRNQDLLELIICKPRYRLASSLLTAARIARYQQQCLWSKINEKTIKKVHISIDNYIPKLIEIDGINRKLYILGSRHLAKNFMSSCLFSTLKTRIFSVSVSSKWWFSTTSSFLICNIWSRLD